MQNRSGCSKRRGLSPLEGEENSDTDIAAISTHRMYPKVRKYGTERDLFTAGIDGPQSESKSHVDHLITDDVMTDEPTSRTNKSWATSTKRVLVHLGCVL
jgi:hypothetical protein